MYDDVKIYYASEPAPEGVVWGCNLGVENIRQLQFDFGPGFKFPGITKRKDLYESDLLETELLDKLDELDKRLIKLEAERKILKSIVSKYNTYKSDLVDLYDYQQHINDETDPEFLDDACRDFNSTLTRIKGSERAIIKLLDEMELFDKECNSQK